MPKSATSRTAAAKYMREYNARPDVRERRLAYARQYNKTHRAERNAWNAEHRDQKMLADRKLFNRFKVELREMLSRREPPAVIWEWARGRHPYWIEDEIERTYGRDE